MPAFYLFAYKITKPLICFTALIVAGTFAAENISAQKKGLNKYGLLLVKNSREFKKSVTMHPDNAMLPLNEFIPLVIIDLKYAGKDNFMKAVLYAPTTRVSFLRKPAVIALAEVQKKLATQGLGLKIWDAYRPYSVTQKMWEPVKDERYAANPKYGSGHNRGIAVDLTLINLTTKKELNMGTGFDHFSDTAHVNFTALPADVLANRRLLQSLMETSGFKILETEWWHFYLPDAKKYDLMDLSFKQLEKIYKSGSY